MALSSWGRRLPRPAQGEGKGCKGTKRVQKGRKDRAREDRGEGSWVNKEGEEKEWKQIKIWTGGYKSDRKCPQCTRGRKRGKDERWLKQIMISCCVLKVNTLKNITPEWIMTTGMRGHWNNQCSWRWFADPEMDEIGKTLLYGRSFNTACHSDALW